MKNPLPHQQRVLEECTLQTFNLDKLREFIAGEQFRALHREERRMLINQEAVMTELVAVLNERIAYWRGDGFDLGAPANLADDGTCEACQ